MSLNLWNIFSIAYVCLANGWHAYNENTKNKASVECEYYEKPVNPDHNSFRQNEHNWRDFNNRNTIKNYIYGFEHGMGLIHKSQNPSDCSKAKYIINPAQRIAGFGSEIHCEGALLGLAIQLGRVLIDNPVSNEATLWKFAHHMCNHTLNKSCYYKPWTTKCTIYDAIPQYDPRIISDIYNGKKIIEDVHLLKISPHSFQKFLKNPGEGLGQGLENIRTIIPYDIVGEFNNLQNITFMKNKTNLYIPFKYVVFKDVIPGNMKKILECSPMKKEFYLYWWRALATAYFMRLNNSTLTWLQEHRTLPIFSNESCIAIYVRRGDKVNPRRGRAEMQAVPFISYANTAELMWKNGLVTPTTPNSDENITHQRNRMNNHEMKTGNETSLSARKGVMFISSEDPTVIQEAVLWGQQTGWKVLYTNIIDRTKAHALTTTNRKHGLKDEYLAMILNIDYSLQCDAWVCTLASNFCRIIDELRATIAGKAHLHFADLSKETCENPPCIGTGIKSFDW